MNAYLFTKIEIDETQTMRFLERAYNLLNQRKYLVESQK